MIYVHARWSHTTPSEPVELFYELDDERFILTMMERFADGRVEYECSKGEVLSDVPVPTIDEINAQPEFHAREVDAGAFNRAWSELVGRPRRD